MIEVLSESEGNILVLKALGKLTDKDYKELLIPRLESIIHEYGKAQLLLEMGDDFHGWEGARWVAWCMKLGALMMSGEVRSYAASERNEAFAWIKV